MAEYLERTLSQLLVPDNDVIKQATSDLKGMINDPAIVPLLCNLLGSSSNAQVRQYAALLLRRKFLKAKHWTSLAADVGQNIRDNLLQVMLRETEKPVQKSVAQLIATLAKHDLPSNRWPALFQFLEQYVRNDNDAHREVGSFLLSCVVSVAHEQLKPHTVSLLSLCSSLLEETHNHHVAFYTLQTLTSIVSSIDSDSQKVYELLVPKIVEVIKRLTAVDQDMAADAFEVLDELAECEVAILQPHIKNVVNFCLEVSKNKELTSKVRVKALSFISTITRQKKKSIVKLNLIAPILAVLFPIMCDCQSDEEEDEELQDAEAHTASSYASQVVDVMALHLPPEKFIPLLMKHVEPAFKSPECGVRRAAYTAIAVVSEGCADHMRSKHLHSLLNQVYQGMSDESPDVRNAAMFALGQFSEHLQPDISKYSSELLPLLFTCMSKTSHDQTQRPRDVIRVYYAMEMFCENLGKEILPYLPQLMDFLLNAINTATSGEAKSLAISAIGATANAAGECILPYFQQIIDTLKHFLVPTEAEDQLKVQIQAIDALGVMARILGDHFRPIASECLQLGLSLLKDTSDPDLRRCIYSLFGSLSTLVKDEMSNYLEVLVMSMILSIRSTEGITAHYSEQDAQILQIFSEESDEGSDIDISEEADDEDEGVEDIKIENAYINEKEDACSAIGELAINTGPAFLPYMEDSYKAVSELLEYPASDMRCAAVNSLAKLCIAVWHIPNADQTVAVTMLTMAVGKMLILVRRDAEREVAMAILESLNEMLTEIKDPVLSAIERPDVVISVIKDVFQQKMACQDDEDDELDDEQAEYDSALIENAGELLPTLAKLLGGPAFAPYFAGLLPELLKKLKTSSKVPEKSFAIGTISETIQALGESASHFVGALYPVFMTTVLDEDEEVRSNAVFGLGVLAVNGGAEILPRYSEILKILFDILGKETDRRCIDNLCAAVCRMITCHTDRIPVAQVLPVVLQCLPLKEDHTEDLTVYQCVFHLYSQHNPEIMSYMPQLVAMAGDLLASKPADDLRQLLVMFVQDVSRRCPEILHSAISLASQDSAQFLHLCVAENSS